ncbi:hypothetical protein SAMN04488062_101396 [Flavobacterium omnivorum]|uniref:Uncharacterized protein n=1 Tax=Flavobacterium omnivorum TaxID=178355 RepID=A0A1G7WAN9_9FLAO|nr:hypothetical protein SAMN04488062_101396 [Flavobacterium omnivorum]
MNTTFGNLDKIELRTDIYVLFYFKMYLFLKQLIKNNNNLITKYLLKFFCFLGRFTKH